MKITKLSHSCLLVEQGALRVLTDPGAYLHEQIVVQEIGVPEVDLVTISHKHKDHMSIESLRMLRESNDKLRIFTNSEVAKELESEDIICEIVEDGSTQDISGVSIRGFGEFHAKTYADETPMARNIGYLIAGRLYHPGDSFTIPDAPVEILAFPMAGGWMKTAEVTDFIKKIQPKYCLPIHNGSFREDRWAGFYKRPKARLGSLDIEFVGLKEGESRNF